MSFTREVISHITSTVVVVSHTHLNLVTSERGHFNNLSTCTGSWFRGVEAEFRGDEQHDHHGYLTMLSSILNRKVIQVWYWKCYKRLNLLPVRWSNSQWISEQLILMWQGPPILWWDKEISVFWSKTCGVYEEAGWTFYNTWWLDLWWNRRDRYATL